MAVFSIIVAQITNREIATAAIELLCPGILILDHQCDIVGVQQIFGSRKEQHSNTLTAEIRVDAEVENPALVSGDITDDTAGNTTAGPSHQYLRPWPEVENEERNQPICLTTPKATLLKFPQFGQITQMGMPDNYPGFPSKMLRLTGNGSSCHDVPRYDANPS